MPLTRILGLGLGLGLVSTRVQPSFDALGRGTTYEDGGELGGLLDVDVDIDFAFALQYSRWCSAKPFVVSKAASRACS